MRDIGTAIQYLHSMNIAHRDVKVSPQGVWAGGGTYGRKKPGQQGLEQSWECSQMAKVSLFLCQWEKGFAH